MATLKELSKKDELFSGGHRLCAGCGIPPIVRRGNIPRDKDMKFIAFGGDGGTYDIGLQALSGALERGHDFLYVCYDNGAYMNTGIQRSSATPFHSNTTTSPAGDVIQGKQEWRKDLTRIVIAHNVPYAAQASPHNWADLSKKAEKALKTKGPTFLNVMSPCPLGWYTKPEDSIKWAKLSVDTCYWPLYEVENGILKVTYKPREKKPLTDWLKPQGRFKHLFKPGNEHILEAFQARVDLEWQRLLDLDGKRV
ncbi:MAG: pyruvate ferredoxin oxidoreductase [Deltaproteobacteria bacterium]|nr:pyruvate ferredoxin oxidoreductase [Deltaproteobacteria bacterium]